MNLPETIVAETGVIGAYALAAEAMWLGFQLVRQAMTEHWFKGQVSVGLTKPDERYPKLPQPAPAATATPIEGRGGKAAA